MTTATDPPAAPAPRPLTRTADASVIDEADLAAAVAVAQGRVATLEWVHPQIAPAGCLLGYSATGQIEIIRRDRLLGDANAKAIGNGMRAGGGLTVSRNEAGGFRATWGAGRCAGEAFEGATPFEAVLRCFVAGSLGRTFLLPASERGARVQRDEASGLLVAAAAPAPTPGA